MLGMRRVVQCLSADNPISELFEDLRAALMQFCRDREDDDIHTLAYTVGW